jgi:beta-lactamase regulating signal transducer with metallopeptidase domain
MDKIFLTVLNMSLTGAVVIAVICLARLPLRKAPKIISYCLWAVAGFRLVFPFSIESMFSLMPFNAQPIPTDIATQVIPRIDVGIPAVNNAVNAALPVATSTASQAVSANPLQFWTTINTYVWIAGAVLMLLYGVVSYIILKRKMGGAAHVEANIYEAENIKSPFVLGFIKPKIYLPSGLSLQERGYILLH